MSRKEKLIERFLKVPKDFTYSELQTLLMAFSYEQVKVGRTGGSRVVFIHQATQHIIRLHRPHPLPDLKRYQIIQIIQNLRERGLI